MEDGLRIVNTIDNSQLERELRKSQEIFVQIVESAEKAGDRIDEIFQKLSHPHIVTDYKDIVDSAKNAVAEIRKAFDDKIDFANPSQELDKFDKQVVLLCGHIEKYFESIKSKLDDLLSVMGESQSMVSKIPVNDGNATHIEQIKRENEGLKEQIKQQTEEIARQKEQWKQLADAVRTNNVSAIQKFSKETDAATKRMNIDAIKGNMKDLEAEMNRYAGLMTKAAGDVEIFKAELDSLRERGAGNEKIAETEELYRRATDKLAQLKSEYNAMSDQQSQYVNQLEEEDNLHVRMRTQIMESRDQMVQMLQAGKAGTSEFQKLAEKTGAMRKEMALANAYMQYFSNPSRHLEALKQGLQGVAGAAGVVVGVIGVFNEKSEKMQEIQTKIQSILSVIVGLETTYSAVRQKSNVMLAVAEFQTWALAKAKKAEASATALATAQQLAYNAVAKANPYILLASGVGLLAVGLYKLVKANKDAAKSEKDRQNQIEETRRKEEHRLKVLGSHTGDLVSKYMMLQHQWKQLRTEAEKTEWLEHNISKFRGLTNGVKDVTDAEKFLVELSPQVVSALKAVAEAEAYGDLYKESIENKAKKWEKRVKSVATGDFYKRAKIGDKISDAEYRAAGLTAKDISVDSSSSVGAWTQNLGLVQSGVDKINRYRISQAVKTRKKLENEYDAEIDTYGSMWDEALKKASDANKKLGNLKIDENPFKETSTATKQAIDELEVDYERLAKLQKDYSEKIAKESRDAAMAVREANIRSDKKGIEQEMELLVLAYDKAKQTILDKKEEWLREAKEQNKKEWEELHPNWKKEGLKYEAPEIKLTPEQEQALNDFELVAKKNFEQGTQRLLNQLQDEYATIEQAIEKIRKDYAAKRKAMYTDDSYTTLREGFTQENVANLNREEKEALEAIDIQFASKEEVFQKWMGQIANYTIEELERALAVAQEKLNKLVESGGGDQKSLTIARAKIATIQGKLKQANVSPDKKAKTEWNELYKVLVKVGDEFGEIGDMVGGLAGEMIKAAGQMAASTVTMINGIQQLAEYSVKATQSTAEGAAAAVSTAEKASVILTVISAAAQAISTIFSFFNKSDSQEKWEKAQKVYEGTIEALDWAIEKQREYARTLAGREAVEAYEIAIANVKREQEAARTLAQQYMNAGASMGSHSHGVENLRNISLDTWQKVAQFFGMDTSAISQFTMAQFMQGKFGSRLEGLFSLDIEQLEQLKTEVPELYGSLDEQARQYYDSIIAAEQKIKDIEKERMESLTGITDTTLADDWAELLTSMDASSKNFADNLENYLRNAVVNSLIKDKYQERLKKLTEQLYKGMQDGTLTRDEAEALREEYRKTVEQAQNDTKKLYEMAGISTTTDQSFSKGVASMSEDTANELNGRFTALQMSNEQINVSAKEILVQATEVRENMEALQSIGLQSLNHLEAIARNTNELYEMNERLARIESNTSNI